MMVKGHRLEGMYTTICITQKREKLEIERLKSETK